MRRWRARLFGARRRPKACTRPRPRLPAHVPRQLPLRAAPPAVLRLPAPLSMAGRLRWGDAADDDDVLPQGTTTGPNERGVITKVEYFRNAKGEATKRTTRIQVIKTETRVFEVRPPWRCAAAGRPPSFRRPREGGGAVERPTATLRPLARRAPPRAGHSGAQCVGQVRARSVQQPGRDGQGHRRHPVRAHQPAQEGRRQEEHRVRRRARQRRQARGA